MLVFLYSGGMTILGLEGLVLGWLARSRVAGSVMDMLDAALSQVEVMDVQHETDHRQLNGPILLAR